MRMGQGIVALALLVGAAWATEAAGQHTGGKHGPGEAAPGLPAGAEAPSMGAVQELRVVATDYAFDAPAVVQAGHTAVRLVNQGSEIHHLQLVRLEQGRTLDELLEALSTGGPPPSWARDVGGPNVALPGGGEFSAVVNLTPGDYALLCVIPSPDGVLHVMKGMSGMLTVVPASTGDRVAAAETPADLTLTLTDYAFGFSRAITPGTHRIRVTTSARQSHEFVVFRLEEGRSAPDVLAWLEGGQQGPPPGLPLGGVVGLAPGEENEITLTFERGRYAFICFLPDVGDGAPHFVHGMIQDYEVR